MKVIIVGDACSGKTTILHMLQQNGYPVLLEEGWQLIPPKIEGNKLQSNLWFTRYYFNRERPFHNKDVILERCLHFQYPFTHAQFQAGKITMEQRDEALLLLDTLASAMPLEQDTVAIHLVCSSEHIWERLEARGRGQHTGQLWYWDSLRELTERYFSTRCKYYQLDTTTRTPEAVYAEVAAILSQAGFPLSETGSRR
ncbi:deoxynucleoside kinase [Candidatus Woesearchaeota archaeon]|nr:deoxynucleoside kinase [Candidatus Woesearchaeota archaeon]